MSLEKPRPQRGILARLATLIGASVAAASPAAAQGADASAAPVEWIRYANGAADVITGWLQADSETAVRFRSYLDQARPDADRPAAPLAQKIWVDRDGAVSRIAFSPFAHAEPNADLLALVSGHRLPGKPPKDMLQPLRVAIQLDPSAESGSGAE